MDERIAASTTADGMPLGNELTPQIQSSQVEVAEDGIEANQFDDDAAATLVYEDYMRAQSWLDNMSWLAEFQYIDYLYQSPNFELDWRQQTNRPARISRFNVAKNTRTMANQTRRAIFAGQTPFALVARGPLEGDSEQEMYLDAWTTLLDELCDRADFEYNLSLGIDCMALQGTMICVPGWETQDVVKKRRKRKAPPVSIENPLGGTTQVNTEASDDFEVIPEISEESWPFFEYRRLGTTFFDPKWRTPNRPDLSASYRIDWDTVTMEDLQQMRNQECYKDIPSDEDLKKFFLGDQFGDADGTPSGLAQQMQTNNSRVVHAEGEQKRTSSDPFEGPIVKITRWDGKNCMEILEYKGRRKTIRNGEHEIGMHALGYSGTWWNIDNSGYGFGIGRLNAGDQRMDQGVLNEVLKMIAYPMNAPLLYNTEDGNAPTQNVVMGLGTMWGLNAGKSGDINKAVKWLDRPEIPQEAWKIYELGKAGGEDLVGANSATMQGNVPGPGSSIVRTASGASRVAAKADEQIAEPVAHLEIVITRWLEFLYEMVCLKMPVKEIRKILSDKKGKAILDQIDMEKFLSFEFNFKVLAGAKLAAKAAIAQLIPFLLSLIQQPQLLQFLHEKGETINFGAIASLFLRMSELQGREDLIIPLTQQQQQMVASMNPAAVKTQIEQMLQKMKSEGKLAEINAQGQVDLRNSIVEKGVERAMARNDQATELATAQARQARDNDADILQNGVPGLQ